MDRMSHELTRMRQAEMTAITARAKRKPVDSDLRDYRPGNGLLRIIRLGRR
jgi:hypothetical protein